MRTVRGKLRPRFDVLRVGPRLRFSEREGEDHLPRGCRNQVPLLLRFAPEKLEGFHADGKVRQGDHGDGKVQFDHLLDRPEVLLQRETGPPVKLGNGKAEQSAPAHPGEHALRDAAFRFDLFGRVFGYDGRPVFHRPPETRSLLLLPEGAKSPFIEGARVDLFKKTPGRHRRTPCAVKCPDRFALNPSSLCLSAGFLPSSLEVLGGQEPEVCVRVDGVQDLPVTEEDR